MMTCEICGRGACSRVFHSIEEQQSFDDVADNIKDRAKEIIAYRINRLDFEWIGDETYVNLDDVLSVVDDY